MGFEYDREEKPLGCCTQFMRGFLMLVNIIFMIASVGGIVLGVMFHEGHADSLKYLEYCQPCKQFTTFLIIVFAVLLVFSFIGFCALWKRNSCLLVLYGFFLVIFFLGAACVVIVIFMIHDGRFDGKIEQTWQETNATIRCDFQEDLNCNGWDTLCPYATTNWTDFNETQKLNCPDCSYDLDLLEEVSKSTQTCHTVMKDDINKYFYILLGVGFGLMALALISIITSCKVRVEYEEYQDLQERF